MKGAPKGVGKRCKGEARPLSTYRRYERKEKKEEREREREKDPEAGRKDRIYQDWKLRILKKMRIEGGGVPSGGNVEVFKTRRPVPRSRQKDTTRATFAGKNPRATGIRLLLTHVAATLLRLSVSVRCRGQSRSHSQFSVTLVHSVRTGFSRH